MSRIRNRDTKPEIQVRSILHRMGYRFRLHRKDLPGRPDIVLPKFRTVILVHGCFWHRHESCPRAAVPSTRRDFWKAKFERNVKRDEEVQGALRALGWRVIVVWECEVADDDLPGRLRGMLDLRLQQDFLSNGEDSRDQSHAALPSK